MGGYKASKHGLDPATITLVSHTLYLAITRDTEELEAPFWFLVKNMEEEQQITIITICQHPITPETVRRAHKHPQWHLQSLYNRIAINCVSKPDKKTFSAAQFALLTVREQSLMIYHLDQGKDLLLNAARVKVRDSSEPVPAI
jgi:hypothetical protein